MAASGKALDSGWYNDRVAEQNAINAGKIDATRAQAFTDAQKQQARDNIGAAQVPTTVVAYRANLGDGDAGWVYSGPGAASAYSSGEGVYLDAGTSAYYDVPNVAPGDRITLDVRTAAPSGDTSMIGILLGVSANGATITPQDAPYSTIGNGVAMESRQFTATMPPGSVSARVGLTSTFGSVFVSDVTVYRTAPAPVAALVPISSTAPRTITP